MSISTVALIELANEIEDKAAECWDLESRAQYPSSVLYRKEANYLEAVVERLEDIINEQRVYNH